MATDGYSNLGTATDMLRGLPAIAKAVGAESPRTAKIWITEQGLPAFRLGKHWVSHTASISRWVQAKAEGRAA